MNILAFGPYIGDIESEILTFRPFVRWHTEVIDHDVVYINSHHNRSFLYDWIDKDYFIPVYENLSRNEFDQEGYIHKTIKHNDFSLFIRNLRNEISNRCDCNMKDVDLYNLSYSKSSPPYSIYRKIFEKLPYFNDVEVDETVVFIPDSREKELVLEEIKYHLEGKNVDFKTIGDMKTHLEDDNEILKNIDYFDICYKHIIQYINKAKLLIAVQ
jgi:hypothetical protein